MKRVHILESIYTISHSNVIVATYGNGPQPVLDASDIVSTLHITKAPSTSNVFQFNATPVNIGGQLFSFFENGRRLSRQTSIAGCDNADGSYYSPSPVNGVDQTINFHPLGHTDATHDGKTYEVTIRDDRFFSDFTAINLFLDGVNSKKSLNNDGTIVVSGTGSLVKNWIAEDGSKHNLFITDDWLVEDCIASKSYSSKDNPAPNKRTEYEWAIVGIRNVIPNTIYYFCQFNSTNNNHSVDAKYLNFTITALLTSNLPNLFVSNEGIK